MKDSEKLRDSLVTMITEKSPSMETPEGEKCKEGIETLWGEFYTKALSLVNDLQCHENIETSTSGVAPEITGEKGGDRG